MVQKVEADGARTGARLRSSSCLDAYLSMANEASFECGRHTRKSADGPYTDEGRTRILETEATPKAFRFVRLPIVSFSGGGVAHKHLKAGDMMESFCTRIKQQLSFKACARRTLHP